MSYVNNQPFVAYEEKVLYAPKQPVGLLHVPFQGTFTIATSVYERIEIAKVEKTSHWSFDETLRTKAKKKTQKLDDERLKLLDMLMEDL